MLNDVLYALWFFAPAGAANVAPILVAKLPGLRQWNTPMDFGIRYRGKRLLGKSKTWRGLLCGIAFGAIAFALQQPLSQHFGSFTTYLEAVHYFDLSPWLGVLLGAGALLGDAVKSFFKRRMAIPPSKSWFPFDQLDYILGGCVFTALIAAPPFKIYLLIFILWFTIHLIASYLGHLLDLKKAPI